MTITLPPDALELRVTHPGEDEPALTVPSSDVIELSTKHKAGEEKGEGSITLDNDGWNYTTGPESTQIGIGDRVTVMGFAGQGGSTAFGTQPFGAGPFTGMGRVGTYLVEDWEIIEHAPGQADLVLEVADYVFGRLEKEVPFYGAENKRISGYDDAIVNELLAEFAPEIDRSKVAEIDTTADYFVNGSKNLREALDDVAKITAQLSGPVVQTSYGSGYYFEPVENIVPRYDEPMGANTTDDGGDFGPWSVSSESQNMANDVRVTGGIDDEGNLDDAQTTVADYVTVTNTNRVWTQVSTRKSELSTIYVYTYGENVSEDGVRVRLQASNDAGDGPINPDSEDSDIVTGTRRKVALDPDGWTKFNMGSHTIPERNPWLIIDSDGETGHEIGVDSNGNPAYRALFPKPIAAEVRSTPSISEYGRHSKHVTNESLVSQAAVRETAKATVNAGKTPDTTLGPLACLSTDAHSLRVGDVVELDRPELRATGEFLVTSKDRTYSAEGGKLTASVELMGVGNYV